MFCAKCGNDVGDGAAGTCSRCGAPLPATGQAQQAGPAYPGQAEPRSTQPGPAQPGPAYPGQTQPGPAQQPGPGYAPPPQGQQYGAPPGGQYAPPPQGQQYGAPPGGQQYGGQPYGAPGAPATGQQPGPAQGWGGAPAPGQAPQGWSQAPRHDAPKFAFDAKRWTPGDITVGVASLVVLIALFLPWFNASVAGFGSGGSESGMDQHGWLWLVFIIVLGILGFLVVKAGFSNLPFTMPFQQELILLAATGLNLLLVLIAFLLKPTVPLSGVSIGWDVGAFLALIAAIVAVIPLVPAARNLTSRPNPQPDGGQPGSGQPGGGQPR